MKTFDVKACKFDQRNPKPQLRLLADGTFVLGVWKGTKFVCMHCLDEMATSVIGTHQNITNPKCKHIEPQAAPKLVDFDDDRKKRPHKKSSEKKFKITKNKKKNKKEMRTVESSSESNESGSDAEEDDVPDDLELVGDESVEGEEDEEEVSVEEEEEAQQSVASALKQQAKKRSDTARKASIKTAASKKKETAAKAAATRAKNVKNKTTKKTAFASKGDDAPEESPNPKDPKDDDVSVPKTKKPATPNEELAEELGLEWRGLKPRDISALLQANTGYRTADAYRKKQNAILAANAEKTADI